MNDTSIHAQEIRAQAATIAAVFCVNTSTTTGEMLVVADDIAHYIQTGKIGGTP